MYAQDFKATVPNIRMQSSAFYQLVISSTAKADDSLLTSKSRSAFLMPWERG